MKSAFIKPAKLATLLLVASTLVLKSCDRSTAHEDPIRSRNVCEARWYESPSEEPRCFELQRRLGEASWAGDVAEIRKAIEDGANVNGGSYQSLSALTSASSEGKDAAVRLLLEFGADVNRVEGVGNTALKTAVYSGHLETARILLRAGADVCEKTETTAFELAEKSANKEMENLLVRHGALRCGLILTTEVSN